MFKLVIADDEGKTTVVPLVRDEITIGRKEGNTIRLTERNISRKHAKLRRSNGSFVLEDLQSFNGVKVNGKKIGNETKLAAGDQILIGDYQLALQVEATDNSATLPETASPAAAQDAVTAMIPAPMSPQPAPMRGPPARLVMMSPPAPGAEYALSRDRMRIGRAEDLEIWVNHRSISREHAEVVLEEGVLRIKDMGSANGLRVNGADTRSHVLQAGDVVELGQVRFRYVPAGEAFTFDEGRTMQMEALAMPPEPAGGGNRTTIFVAGGILAIAVIAGAVIALSGSPDGPTATSIAPLPTTTVATPSVVPTTTVAVAPSPTVPVAVVDPGPALEAQIATETAACQTSINSGNFAEALAHAGTALSLRPDDAAAAACQDRATQEQTQSGAFVAGLAQLRNGDLESAYLSFESLPVDSTYRQRPEVVDTMTRFATDTITTAESLVSSNPTEAGRLAEAVLNMVQAPPALTARAQDVVRRTHTHVTVAAARPRLIPPSHAPTPTHTPAPTHTATPTPVAPPPVAPPPPTTTASPPDSELQEAIIAGDSRTIIRLLGGGRAHGATQMRALFNAQRETGDRTGACTTARAIIASPGGVPAAQLAMIRQYQATQCH
jgi:pSer/pThr/pTyr-binding forkhead associated (FHA) protein